MSRPNEDSIRLPLPPGTMVVFDLIAGEIKTGDYAAMWEEAARFALIWRKKHDDLEEAIQAIWELTGCFRTEDAESIAVRIHELARSALGGDTEEEEQ